MLESGLIIAALVPLPVVSDQGLNDQQQLIDKQENDDKQQPMVLDTSHMGI